MVSNEKKKIGVDVSMDFQKKFNIGLTLDTSFSDFKSFLNEYHPYIHSFYFSLPTSRYYHTRTKVAAEFMIPGKKKMFWDMLALAREYDIELELLFNTLRLDDALIEKAALTLEQRGVDVDSVCFLRPYYDSVTNVFPDKKYIWSFNNGFRSQKEISSVLENYRADAIVLGSLFIRNNALFDYLNEHQSGAYLLLNNGCSFNCDTCNNTQSVCSAAFERNLKQFSVEYLYALQSIFPEELHEGIIQADKVKCLKISNRSSHLRFVANAMDSYMHNEVLKYILSDRNNLAIWGRAGYFWKHYPSMDVDAIFRHKEEILHRIRENK